MATGKELRKKLRSLARSLRPFEQEMESMSQELNEALIRIDDDPNPEVTPAAIKRYCEMNDIQAIADDACNDLRQIRRDIARYFQPKPKNKEETRRKATRKAV